MPPTGLPAPNQHPAPAASTLARWTGRTVQGAPMLTRLVDAGAAQAAQGAFLRELLPDALGFAGAVMTRRIVGIAHVADMESIADPDTRCERL